MAPANHNCVKYIYIADDDQDDRTFFTDAILELDPSVVIKEAHDGMQLMEILYGVSHRLPDVIFLDINMPKMNGLDCLKEIRQHAGDVSQVMVIMLSTSDDPANIDRALELGATFYAVKPSSYDQLKLFLEDVLKMDLTILTKQSKFRLI